ncbi:MAG TPA: ABC transporter permease [Terriglobales bacterium]|nr:ABC transporter permease [Terriglobales bacterium]
MTVQPRGHAGAAAVALIAIVERDLLVIRREAPAFLVQTLVQPLFFLFVFGKVLTSIGATASSFSVILLPGVVAFTCFLTPLQAVSIDLGRDLGFTREIDDRLLAPLPNALVAIEKFGIATLRGLVAGACVFPLAYLILGSGYHVRTDEIGVLAAMMLLTALLGAAIGVLLGTVVPITHLGLIFSLLITPLLFTGCTYYPWTSLAGIRWFQVVTLFNPLTYAAEGLRHAMLPPIAGHPVETLPLGWVLLVLCGSLAVVLGAAIRLFRRRVVS